MKKQINRRHLTTDKGDGRGEVLSCDESKKAGVEHFTATRAAFEKLRPSHRCDACDKKLAAHKARLLAEVAEIETRDIAAGRWVRPAA